MDEDTTDTSIPQILYGDSILSDVANISSLPDNTSSSLQKTHPNILKKRELPSKGPIQNLPFSPSRFLNSSADVTTVKTATAQEDTFCICSTEDSGIEISTCDVDGLFSNPITSTPIAKRQRQASVSTSFELDSRLCESYLSAGPESLFEDKKTVNHTPERVAFRTPLIRRFLNESGPRTPTPFKFDGNSFRISVEGQGTIVIDSSYNKKSSKKRHKFETPSVHEWPGRRKARKALNLDSTYLDAGDKMLNAPKKPSESLKPFLYRTQLRGNGLSGWRNGSFYSKHVTGSVLKQSSLLDGSFQESKPIASGRIISQINLQGTSSKSMSSSVSSPTYNPRNSTDNLAYSVEMNERLVRIACGHSEDQKLMTIAAKRYLKSLQASRATDSLKIIPQNRRLSRHLLR